MANTQTSLTFDMIGRDKGASKAIQGVGKAAQTASGQLDKAGKSGAGAADGIGKTGRAARDISSELDKAGESADGLGEKFKGLAIGAGALAGVGLGAAFVESLDIEAANDKLAGQLDLTQKESKRIGGIAGSLYAGAYGDSMEDVNNAVGAVMSSIRGMSNASSQNIETATKAALNFASAFEVDVSRAAQVAGQLVQEGLAKNATGAFDLLIKASQEVPAAVREDLLDASDEYGQFFRTLGFDGEEAFGVLVEASKKGMYGIDKAGDAIKEFTIRATDGSETTQKAFGNIGLNANNMSDQILAGGDTAREAFDKIIDGLLGIKDPSERARTALQLFGTPLEDMNVQDIPKFLKGLQSTGNELEGVAGSAKELDKTLGGNAKTTLTSFTRQMQTFATNVLGNQVIPKLEEYGKSVQDNFGPLVSGAVENVQKLPGPMKDFGVALGVAALAGPKLTTALNNMQTGISDFMTGVKTAPNKITALKESVRGLAGVAGLTLLATNSQDASAEMRGLQGAAGGALAGFAAGPWGAAAGAVGGFLLSVKTQAKHAGTALTELQEQATALQETFSERQTGFLDTLDKTTGAFTKQSYALARTQLEQSGVLRLTELLGIKSKNLVTAALDPQGKAWRRLHGELDEARKSGRLTTDEWGSINSALFQVSETAGRAREDWHRLSSGMIDDSIKVSKVIKGSQQDVTRYQEQLNKTPKEVATELLAEGIEKAVGGTQRFRDQVNQIMDSIRDEAVDIKLSASAARTASKIASVAESFHAEGGKVHGPGSGTSDSVRARLSKGEYVIRERVAKQIYPFLGALNSGQAEAMEAAGARTKKGRIRFAEGGMVIAGTNAMTPMMQTSSAITGIQNYAHAYQASLDSFGDRLGTALSKALNQMLAFGGNGQPLGPGGTLSMGQIFAGQQFAKSQAGKPYVWAGVGPGGYDCSGFQSAVLNAALGQYPYSRRGSTGTMPWPGSRPGVGRYTIGWFTGSPGHTSGNIGGLGVESRGGDGVVVGSGATSPLSSMFNGLMHYEKGTSFVPRTGPAVLHRGEAVIPASQNRGMTRAVIEVDGQQLNAIIRELVREEVHDEFAYQHGGI